MDLHRFLLINFLRLALGLISKSTALLFLGNVMFHVFHFCHPLCNFNRTRDPRVWYHFLVCNTNDISKVVCVCVRVRVWGGLQYFILRNDKGATF